MTLAANVVNNTLEFLKRVDMKGLEAFAFVEAYTAIQKEVTGPGVPFVPPTTASAADVEKMLSDIDKRSEAAPNKEKGKAG